MAIVGEDSKHYKERNLALNEEIAKAKRKFKEAQEEASDLHEKLKLTQEQNEKIKEKEK